MLRCAGTTCSPTWRATRGRAGSGSRREVAERSAGGACRRPVGRPPAGSRCWPADLVLPRRWQLEVVADLGARWSPDRHGHGSGAAPAAGADRGGRSGRGLDPGQSPLRAGSPSASCCAACTPTEPRCSCTMLDGSAWSAAAPWTGCGPTMSISPCIRRRASAWAGRESAVRSIPFAAVLRLCALSARQAQVSPELDSPAPLAHGRPGVDHRPRLGGLLRWM